MELKTTKKLKKGPATLSPMNTFIKITHTVYGYSTTVQVRNPWEMKQISLSVNRT